MTKKRKHSPAAGTVSALFASTLLGNIQGVPLLIGMATSSCMRYGVDYQFMATDSRTAGYYIL